MVELVKLQEEKKNLHTYLKAYERQVLLFSHNFSGVFKDVLYLY